MHLPQPSDAEFELAPAGTHIAVCYRVIDLGTQETTFKGEVKHQHKILISWEIPDEKMKDGRPFTIGKRYTWSMSEKANLRNDLESWRGKFTAADFGPKGFNIKSMIGKAGIITVTHSNGGERKYSNVVTVTGLMKGMKAASPVNEPVYLWLAPGLFDPDAFHKLGKGLQEAIMKSPEYRAVANGHDDHPHFETENPGEGLDDVVPGF